MELKGVVIGSPAAGKTCLLYSHFEKSFPREYIPTVHDFACSEVEVDGKKYMFYLCDTAGGEDYPRLRRLSYVLSKVFILCVSVNSTDLDKVWDGWYPELSNYCPEVPIILVGTKSDKRREEESDSCISIFKFIKLATRIGAFAYVECSALESFNIYQVMYHAIRTGAKKQKKKGLLQKLKSLITDKTPNSPFAPVQKDINPIPPPPTDNQNSSLFLSLPEHILDHVFKYLYVEHLVKFCTINKFCNTIANKDTLWINLCKQMDHSFSAYEQMASNYSPKKMYCFYNYGWINDFSVLPDKPPPLTYNPRSN